MAHPDDESFGMGASIAKLAGQGHDVFVYTISEGARRAKDLAIQRKRACDILGVREVLTDNDPLPDNESDAVTLLEMARRVERVVKLFKPEVVYTHHDGDANQDHVRLAQAVRIATRPVPWSTVRSVYAFEVPSSTEYGPRPFVPNHHEALTLDHLLTKIRACKEYKTELRAFPHPRSVDAIKALARWRGAAVGVRAAEAFIALRTVSSDD